MRSPGWSWLFGVALGVGACGGVQGASLEHARASPANVLILLADDLGYGDIGVQGCADIPTPNIDALAHAGVRCTSAYVCAPRCAPSRCGLLTGRYPQRFHGEVYPRTGLPRSEITLAERLKPAGYVSGLIGKWDAGHTSGSLPNERGFDEFFGFLTGTNPYLPGADGFVPNILRNHEPAQETGYLTAAFGREALDFLERHRAQPFFLCLSFSAPHTPLQATPKYLTRCAHIADPGRRAYAAMVSALDDGVGLVLAKLHELGLDERTLVFFLSDNGAPIPIGQSYGTSNAPLRGQKASTWEGGIRVPFIARWTGKLPAGFVYDVPVSALDIHPTVLALAGLRAPEETPLDGVDILPFLAGRADGAPHEALFWRFSHPVNRPELHKWAVRIGDLKLVHSPVLNVLSGETLPEAGGLFDVFCDPGETNDLSAAHPELVRALSARWQSWSASLPPPEASLDPDGERADGESDF